MITYVVFGWLLCAVFTGFIAHVKNLTRWKWCLVGVGLGPIAVASVIIARRRLAADWGDDGPHEIGHAPFAAGL